MSHADHDRPMSNVIALVFIAAETYGGYVGLAITQTVGLVGLVQWEIRQLASLENQMTSVERVLDYANCPQEADFKSPRGNYKNASFVLINLS